MGKLNLNLKVVLCDYITGNRIITTLGQLSQLSVIMVNLGIVYKFYADKPHAAYTGKTALTSKEWTRRLRPFMHRNDSLSDNYHKMTMCEILYNIPNTLYDHIETLELWRAELRGLTFSKRGCKEWTGDLINKDKKLLNRKYINNQLYGDNQNPAFKWETYFD